MKLDQFAFKEKLGAYFLFSVSKGDFWQFFNPKTRSWDFLKVKKDNSNDSFFVLFRNNWVVRKLIPSSKQQYYYICIDEDLKAQKRNEAIIHGYQYSPGIFKIPAVLKEKIVYVDIRKVFLPEQIYKDLITRALHVQSDEKSTNFLCFNEKDMHKIYSIFHTARIWVEYKDDFIETEPSMEETEISIETIASLISSILSKSYSYYLKSESEIENFILALYERNFRYIEGTSFVKDLELLFEQVDKENIIAKNFLNYLIDNITSYFDWSYLDEFEIDPEITGIIYKANPLSSTNNWKTNYYKLYIPDLELFLHWPTSIYPKRIKFGSTNLFEVRLKKVTLKRWRIYPYLGRLKNTGTRDTILFDERDPELISRSFMLSTGIPSIEFILSQKGYLQAFNIDMGNWKGHYELSRFFLAIVRIERNLEISSPTPVTIVKDIFGNRFTIKWDFHTYKYNIDTFHDLKSGGWISVLLRNDFFAFKKSKQKNKAFYAVDNFSIRFLKKDEAFKANIVALVKYFGFISKERLISLKCIVPTEQLEKLVIQLIEEGYIFEYKGNVYYIYNCTSRDFFQKMIQNVADPSFPHKIASKDNRCYMFWSLINENSALIHPLTYSYAIFQKEHIIVSDNEYKNYDDIQNLIFSVKLEHGQEMSVRKLDYYNHMMINKDESFTGKDVYVGKKDELNYFWFAKNVLQNNGTVNLLASGRRIAKAHRIVLKLKRMFAHMAPHISRDNTQITHEKGYNVKAVKFVITLYGRETQSETRGK